MPADTNSTTATAVRDIPTLPISYVNSHRGVPQPSEARACHGRTGGPLPPASLPRPLAPAHAL